MSNFNSNTTVLTTQHNDNSYTLINVKTTSQEWAELITNGEVEVSEEGSEFFLAEGLFTVQNGEWKELEVFFEDAHRVFFEDGGSAVFIELGSIEFPERGSEYTIDANPGELFEVEGGVLRTPEGITWEWVEEDDANPGELFSLKVDSENNAECWWESGGRELWTLATRLAIFAEEDQVVLSSEYKGLLEVAKAIPGWNDGPEKADTALLIWEDQEDILEYLESVDFEF